jgi:hypothetical protein
MPSKAKKQKSKKVTKHSRIKKSDLLPESQEFLMEKELAKEKKIKIIEMSRLLKEKEKQAESPINYEDDSHKRLAMWTGVIFFMVLVFAVWVYNIKATFRAPADNNKESDFSWDKISEDFKKAMGDIKENISEIKSTVKTATTTEEAPQLSKEEIEKLKEKLEVMENSLGTSTEESEVAASSLKN